MVVITKTPGVIARIGTVEFWLLFATLAAGSLFLLRQGARTYWRLRTITDTPTARIQSAAQG